MRSCRLARNSSSRRAGRVWSQERAPHTSFSELNTIINMSGCAADGRYQELKVGVVEAGEGVAEIDRDAVGEACRDLQHPLLASGAGKARAQGGDHSGPVDHGDRLSAADAGVGGDEPAGEVVPMQPGLGDEQLGGGFET